MELDGKLRTLIRQLVSDGIPLKQACHEFEAKYIEETLASCNGSVSMAAKALGIHRNTLYNQLKPARKKGGRGKISPSQQRSSRKRKKT